MMRRRVFHQIAKWIVFAVASLALTMTTAHAGGLWLYEQGTPDVGTANAGMAARAEDAATAFANPAGMTWLDVQYYIWEEDATGRILAERLIRAADRGVRVRILVDDINLAGRDANVASMDAHPNIEIRLFNPEYRMSSCMGNFHFSHPKRNPSCKVLNRIPDQNQILKMLPAL